MSKLVDHVKSSLEKTENLESNLTDEVLNMEGMSGKKTRHFYNNLCSLEKARYLEIGSWKGSSSCSALCNNKLSCLCIDNWSEFGGPKEEFLANFNKYKGTNDAQFLERNCWDIETSCIGRFNIYMYDGDHDGKSHFQALNHYLPCLDNEFIYLVDDWNWQKVRDGTNQAIKENKCEILYKKEIYTRSNNPNNDWHNGICIFVLKK